MSTLVWTYQIYNTTAALCSLRWKMFYFLSLHQGVNTTVGLDALDIGDEGMIISEPILHYFPWYLWHLTEHYHLLTHLINCTCPKKVEIKQYLDSRLLHYNVVNVLIGNGYGAAECCGVGYPVFNSNFAGLTGLLSVWHLHDSHISWGNKMC